MAQSRMEHMMLWWSGVYVGAIPASLQQPYGGDIIFPIEKKEGN